MDEATLSLPGGLGRLLRTPKTPSASPGRVAARGVGQSQAGTAPNRMGQPSTAHPPQRPRDKKLLVKHPAANLGPMFPPGITSWLQGTITSFLSLPAPPHPARAS